MCKQKINFFSFFPQKHRSAVKSTFQRQNFVSFRLGLDHPRNHEYPSLRQTFSPLHRKIQHSTDESPSVEQNKRSFAFRDQPLH